MLRRFALLSLGLAFALSAAAQSGFVTLTNSEPLLDQGAPIQNGYACLQMKNVPNGQQIGAHVGVIGGQASGRPQCSTVNNGYVIGAWEPSDPTAAGTNLVPDPVITGFTTWTQPGTWTTTAGSGNSPLLSAVNVFAVGSAASGLFQYSGSAAITVAPGQPYTVSGFIDASQATGSNAPGWYVATSAGAAALATITSAPGAPGAFVQASFIVPAGVTTVYIFASTRSATIPSGHYIFLGAPLLQAGSDQLVDTSLSAPANQCYELTITSNVSTGGDGSTILGGDNSGYTCLQPAYNNTWCTNGVCDLSKYVPTTTPGVAQVAGPAGPAGPTGPQGPAGTAAASGGTGAVQIANSVGQMTNDSTVMVNSATHQLMAGMIGALTQGSVQSGSAWGEKLLACMAAARSAGTDFCDMRALSGSQALDANLALTPSNASNMVILLPANLSVNQGSWQVHLQNGITNLTIESDLFGSNTGGTSGGATFTGCTTSGYVWSFDDATALNSFTAGIILKDFAIEVQASASCNGEGALYLGGGMNGVRLENLTLGLPTTTSDPSHSLVLNVPSSPSGLYSQHLEIDNPFFSGGTGVIETGTGLNDWAQVNVRGGFIFASTNTGSLSSLSQSCVTQQQGEFTMEKTDLENCFAGLHTYMGGQHGDIRPDGCCTTYSIVFDGSAATGNQYRTDLFQSPAGTSNAGGLANVNINGAKSNGATPNGGAGVDFDGSEVGGSGFGTGAIVHTRLDDSELDVIDAAGKTAVQNVCKIWGDTSTGALNYIWEACKNTANGWTFGINTTIGTTAYNWQPLSFDLTNGFGLNSFGTHALAIDYGNATTAGPGLNYYGGGTSCLWCLAKTGAVTATGAETFWNNADATFLPILLRAGKTAGQSDYIQWYGYNNAYLGEFGTDSAGDVQVKDASYAVRFQAGANGYTGIASAGSNPVQINQYSGLGVWSYNGSNTRTAVLDDGAGNGSWTGNVTVHGGTNTLYRCTTAGTLPVGALTTVTGNCGASADTGLRVN